MKRKVESFEDSMDEAMRLFWENYAASFPTGGDQADHDEATRAGVEAVLIGTPIRCEHCGELA